MHGSIWTEEELRQLRECWKEMSARSLAKRLPGRKWYAIYHKAQDLGLPMGPPQGYETFSHAAKRTGFTRSSLGPLLKRHGVSLWHGYRRLLADASRHYYVDPYDVDQAIAADLKLENIAHAAVRVGLSKTYLGKLLCRHGYRLGKGKRARLPPEVFDRVASESRKKRAA